MMVETQALGMRFPLDGDKRIEGAGKVGAHSGTIRQPYRITLS